MNKALIKIQQKLKAPKGNYNSFGKYKYRSCEDILEAVKPLLKETGAQLTLTDFPVFSGDWHYIKATARFESEGEEAVEVSAYARESAEKKGMDDSQITGTASSYARKYALNGLFLIDDTKDADTDEYAVTTGKEKAKVKYATDTQVNELKDLCKAKGVKWMDVVRKHGDPSEWTEEDVAQWIEAMK